MKPLWWLVNAGQALFVAGWTVLWVSAALLALLFSGRRGLGLTIARRCWAPGILWGFGARLRVEGLEHVDRSKPALFVANHQSMLDIPAVYTALPCELHFIVKQELRKVPFLGWYIAAMGMIFVERSERVSSLASLRRGAELIRAGRSVISFPEGTRSLDGEIARFKTGAFVLAIEAGVPITPIAIEGAAAVVPPGRFYSRPGLVRVAIGEPLTTAGLTMADRGTLAQQARARVEELRDRLRAAAES